MMSEDPTFKDNAERSQAEVMNDDDDDDNRKVAASISGGPSDSSRTGGKHDATANKRTDKPPNIRIVNIEDVHLPQICDLLNESFHSKRCLLCLPVAESLEELQQRYREMPDAKRRLGAVAIDAAKKTVLGYVQMTAHGLPVYPEDFHTCQRDELYIEIVAVSDEARGQGIGTKLLEWCQTVALEHSPEIARIELEVLRGNRAIQLYERFGFDIKPLNDCWGEFCSAILVCCMLGRPYGLCHKEWGAVEMEMILKRGDTTA